MQNFKRNKQTVPKYLEKNEKPAQRQDSAALKRAQRSIVWQAGLALVTIILTIVIVFAMTSAWYTNIVQTNGLVFEAEAWGFDGEILVNSDAIVAAPGDSGVVHMEVENSSDSISAISVNVSKLRMIEEMQQRLYFYVDTQMTRNGETMDRVYLNNEDSYTYTVFNGGKLVLTEAMHNDAQLKWHWVYDVLGYYVLGQEMIVDGQREVTVMEYLRPIEYNYDDATTTFEKTEEGDLVMVLKTVDGKTTADEFLVELSKTDGYEGQIDPNKKLESGYYPVDVDESGYGVYAYLCNYSEIELATQFDTALGMAAANGELEGVTYEAKLTLSAQKNKNTVVNVSTLAALKEAMAMDAVDVIQLSSNITITDTENLVIPENSRVMLDLNGYTISSTTKEKAIVAEPGSSLAVMNGEITGPTNGGYAVYTTGAEAIFSNVKIRDFGYGVYVGDSDNNNSLDSRVRLINCEIDAGSYAVVVSGNGLSSEQQTQLIVEGCKIRSDVIGISGNGTASGNGRWGTDIQILNSEVVGNPDKVSVGIYHPQKDSNLTIYNSVVSGYTGITIKSGFVSVNASTVTGLGAKQEPSFGNSGSSDTGDGIYIETNYGHEITLEIGEMSTISSANSYSLQVFEPDATNVAIEISSGIFKEAQPEEYIAEGSIQEGTTVRVE